MKREEQKNKASSNRQRRTLSIVWFFLKAAFSSSRRAPTIPCMIGSHFLISKGIWGSIPEKLEALSFLRPRQRKTFPLRVGSNLLPSLRFPSLCSWSPASFVDSVLHESGLSVGRLLGISSPSLLLLRKEAVNHALSHLSFTFRRLEAASHLT